MAYDMIQRTDIFNFVWVCRGIWWGREDEQVNQDLERAGMCTYVLSSEP